MIDIYKKTMEFIEKRKKEKVAVNADENKILKCFLKVIGNDKISSDDKLWEINKVLIKEFNLKYSTIVTFNGKEYIIKATNVDTKFWNLLKNLHNEQAFKECILRKETKYYTIKSERDILPYQRPGLELAKSAFFSPIYSENVYIGYWFMESGEINAFNKIDKEFIEIVCENIIYALNTISYQRIVENGSKNDSITDLDSVEYLYSKGKEYIDKYSASTLCVLEITNLVDINDGYGREFGNIAMKELVENIKIVLSEDDIFVRYVGAKFVIIFSGSEPKDIKDVISELKYNIEKIKIMVKKDSYVLPRLNIVVVKYYSGSCFDIILKEIDEYLEENAGHNDIHYLNKEEENYGF